MSSCGYAYGGEVPRPARRPRRVVSRRMLKWRQTAPCRAGETSERAWKTPLGRGPGAVGRSPDSEVPVRAKPPIAFQRPLSNAAPVY